MAATASVSMNRIGTSHTIGAQCPRSVIDYRSRYIVKSSREHSCEGRHARTRRGEKKSAASADLNRRDFGCGVAGALELDLPFSVNGLQALGAID